VRVPAWGPGDLERRAVKRPGDGEGGDVQVGAAETHISALFFYRDRVLKVRKPVRYGFVDFVDLDQRRLDCEREVRLNRRLAPDVYLGTATVSVGGEAVEHAVVMRRLPAERNLEHLVTGGEPVDDQLRRIADTLVAFHRNAERSSQVDTSATADALWQRWLGVSDDLAPYVGSAVDARRHRELTRLASRYLAGRGPLLDERISEGAIVDGHGDLQAADVFCLDDGPRILDCLEFDDRLRHGDRLADVAFLVADLERLGATGAAERFAAAYLERSGDSPPPSLLDFYVASRAYVRVLVECLKGGGSGHSRWGDAARLLDVAEFHLQRGAVRLVLVGGPPGSGKSTLATWLGRHLKATVLRSDEVREESGIPRGDERRYTTEQRDLVYERMCQRALANLTQGRSVVLDATWAARRWRVTASEVATRAVADLYEVRCECPPGLRSARIAGRRPTGAGTSEVTPSTADLLAATADPWPAAVPIDCSGPVEESGRAALVAVRSA
jgi:uncharacterized protein